MIGVPAQISLGPGMAPDSMPFRMENETSLRAPISRTVVVPLIRMRRMALVARMSSLSGFSVRASSCALGPAEQCMWQCASQRPGRSDTSPRSRTVYLDPMSDGSCDAGVTAVIRPSSTRTAWSSSHPETSALATREAMKTVFFGTITPVGRITPQPRP